MARMRPRVHTEKHIKQQSLLAVAGGAITNIGIATAVAVPTSAVLEVREGCTISAVYVEIWITGDDAVQGTAIVSLEKVPAGATNMTAAQSAALNAYPNKRNVFHVQMGLTPPNTQYPMASIKGWFKIPKGKQRMALGDELVLNIHGQSDGVSACGVFIYKEQF